MLKRSFSIAGHRTSVALEPEFWAALEAMASVDGRTVIDLIRAVDKDRTEANLASALRLAVLRFYRSGAIKGSPLSQ